MNEDSVFTGAVVAHRVARERAAVASALAERVLHLAVLAAEDDGLSSAQAAAALGVSVDVIRHHRSDTYVTPELPADGTNATWLEGTRAIWAHDADMLRDQWGPFER